ncbi:MAG TPA: hypothetical protein VG605_22750 [Puia sp.]|nr:hypothetical protein [Puia sp.]
MTQHRFRINIISNRRQLEAIYSMNSAPGWAFFASVIILLKLELQYHWYFILALAGMFLSVIMLFFPFYSNAVVYISAEGITLERRKSIVRSMKWSSIQYITFADRGAPSDYGNHIETIIRLHDEEVKFGVYRYLFKSKRTITKELIRALLEFPEARNKLPGELVERYSPGISDN